MFSAALQSLLIFLIIFSCLFYGSVTTRAFTIVEILAGFAIIIWLADMVHKRRLSFAHTGQSSAYIIVFLGIVIFQLVPLPINLIQVICGNTAHLYASLIPPDGLRPFFSLSIYPYVTLLDLFKLLAYIGIFLIIINNIQTKRQFDRIVNTIIFLGLSISIFGIIQKYTYSGKVYWFDPPGSGSLARFGPFVNRNNFAGYINMIIPLAFGYSLADVPLAKRVIYGFSAGIMSLALFLSLSRGGILVYIAVLSFILIFSRFKNSLREKTRILAILFFAVFILSFLLVDFKVVWQRLATLFEKDTFAVLGHGYSWRDILRIWRDFPLFGTGLGTFRSISPMYKTTLAQSLFTYAHNDYLQLLSEVGLAGFIFVLLFFIFYFIKVFRAWFKRHNSYVVCLALGGTSSIFGMLVYSLLDFNLHIPAVALLFFIIMGLVYRLVYMQLDKADLSHGSRHPEGLNRLSDAISK